MQAWAWGALAVTLAALWASGLGAGFRRGGVEVERAPVVFAAALVGAGVLAQLLPLPAALVALFSPTADRLLLAALPEYGAGGWRPLTLDLPGTLDALLKGGSYLLAFLLAARLGRLGRARPLLVVLVALGALETLYGLFRVYHGQGAILGVPTPSNPTRASGTYVSPTHLAGLLGMAIPAALGLAALIPRGRPVPERGGLRLRLLALATDPSTPQRLLFLFAAVVMAVGLAATLSRGGVLACLFGVAALALALTTRPGRGRARAGLVIGLAASAAALWVGSIGVERLMTRFLKISEEWGPSAANRLAFALDTARIGASFPLSGFGAGGFEAVYPHFQSVHAPGRVLSHAHNDYLELLAELGLPLFTALALGVGLTWVRAWRSARRPDRALGGATAVVCLCALLPLAVHSLVDFNLRIPANALWASALLGLAWGAARRRGAAWIRPRTRARRRLGGAALLLALVALGGGGVLRGMSDWAAEPFVGRSQGDSRPVAVQLGAIERGLALWPWRADLHAKRARLIWRRARLAQREAARAAARELLDPERTLAATEELVVDALTAARLGATAPARGAALEALGELGAARRLTPASLRHAELAGRIARLAGAAPAARR